MILSWVLGMQKTEPGVLENLAHTLAVVFALPILWPVLQFPHAIRIPYSEKYNFAFDNLLFPLNSVAAISMVALATRLRTSRDSPSRKKPMPHQTGDGGRSSG
jgi:hypothetical protein